MTNLKEEIEKIENYLEAKAERVQGFVFKLEPDKNILPVPVHHYGPGLYYVDANDLDKHIQSFLPSDNGVSIADTSVEDSEIYDDTDIISEEDVVEETPEIIEIQESESNNVDHEIDGAPA